MATWHLESREGARGARLADISSWFMLLWLKRKSKEEMEVCGTNCAIRVPANHSLEQRLTRPTATEPQRACFHQSNYCRSRTHGISLGPSSAPVPCLRPARLGTACTQPTE